ncbi:MAG: cell wall-binding repeat-containing protein [Peptococcaceae bacterium]|nr:cell wall-binding repeat-containing protein [Peptococcaceae bacterium]
MRKLLQLMNRYAPLRPREKKFQRINLVFRRSKPLSLKRGNVCLVTGRDFPDALAGSVYAANRNSPVILVEDSLSGEQKDYIKGRKFTGITLFGGENVIRKDVEEQLGELIQSL